MAPDAKRRRKRELSDSDYSPGDEESDKSDSEAKAVVMDKFTKEKTFQYVRSKFPNEDIMVGIFPLSVLFYSLSEDVADDEFDKTLVLVIAVWF